MVLSRAVAVAVYLITVAFPLAPALIAVIDAWFYDYNTLICERIAVAYYSYSFIFFFYTSICVSTIDFSYVSGKSIWSN